MNTVARYAFYPSTDKITEEKLVAPYEVQPDLVEFYRVFCFMARSPLVNFQEAAVAYETSFWDLMSKFGIPAEQWVRFHEIALRFQPACFHTENPVQSQLISDITLGLQLP